MRLHRQGRHYILQNSCYLGFSLNLPTRKALTQKGSTLKGKNLLLKEQSLSLKSKPLLKMEVTIKFDSPEVDYTESISIYLKIWLKFV